MRCARRSLWLNVNQKVLHAHINQTLLLKYFRQERQVTQHLGATLPPFKAQPKNTNALASSERSLCRTTPTLETADASAILRSVIW